VGRLVRRLQCVSLKKESRSQQEATRTVLAVRPGSREKIQLLLLRLNQALPRIRPDLRLLFYRLLLLLLFLWLSPLLL
jgi:hypothetical protein